MVEVNLDRRAVQIKYDASLVESDDLVYLRCTAGDDVSSTFPHPNNGFGVITYPADYSGSTFVEVIDEDGNVVDSGEISV